MLSKEKCYVCWVFQTLNLRVVWAVRIALQVDYPSNQKEQDAHAEQHGGFLVDVRQWVRIDHNPSWVGHPL